MINNCSIKNTKRIDNIDLLESIAMFFVIVYHTSSDIPHNVLAEQSVVDDINYCVRSILSTCVPLFFFCNGFLLFNRSFNLKKHLIKTFRLFVLALVWGLLSASFTQFVIHEGETFNFKEFIVILVYTKVGWNNHLWFLQALIVLYLLFPLLKNSFDNARPVFKYAVVMVFIIVMGCNFFSEIVTILWGKHIENFNFFVGYNPIRIEHSHSLMYFLIGGTVGSYHDKLLSLSSKRMSSFLPCSLFAIICSSILLGIYGMYVSKLDGTVWDNVWNGYGTIFTLSSVLLFYVASLSYHFKGNIINIYIRIVSCNTLGIYFLQFFFTKVFNEFCKPYLSTYGLIDDYIEKIMCCMIILLLCLLTTLAIKRIPITKKLL